MWDAALARLGRAVPGLGLAGSVWQAFGRLTEARQEDAAYRDIMASMETVPKLPHGTEQQFWHELVGEVSGHLVALAVGGGVVWMTSMDAIVAWSATWTLAFFADWVGGKAGRAWSGRVARRVLGL